MKNPLTEGAKSLLGSPGMGPEVLSEEVNPLLIVDVSTVVGVDVPKEGIHVGGEDTQVEVERALELVPDRREGGREGGRGE